MEEMRASGNEDAVNQLRDNFLNEIEGLINGYSIDPAPSVLALINELTNF